MYNVLNEILYEFKPPLCPKSDMGPENLKPCVLCNSKIDLFQHCTTDAKVPVFKLNICLTYNTR